MPLVDLLLPACGVEFDHLDVERVVEVGHARVVERQVPVLPDAQAAQVKGVPGQEIRIAGAGGRDVTLSVDVVRRLRCCGFDDPFSDPPLESGRMVGPDADVLVHVKDDRVRPGDVLGRGHECLDECTL